VQELLNIEQYYYFKNSKKFEKNWAMFFILFENLQMNKGLMEAISYFLDLRCKRY
jgi:adenine/guanine phosphoribosyltransferase-like PRPP-binding protein